MSRLLDFCLLGAVACGALIGCTSFERAPVPGETAGTIYVNSPRVTGRERLINERRADDEWLQRELKDSETEQFESSGLIDTRSLALTAARMQARVDPALDVYRAQQKAGADLVREQGASALATERLRTAAVDGIRAKLDKGEIDAKEANAQLQALGITFPAFVVPAASSTAPSVKGAGSEASDVGSPFLENARTGSTRPPSSSDAVSSNATASPIDRFRDRLALREEIASQRNENAGDDTHDLYRHTLYRLTFDATVLPDNDTSAWAVVDVEFSPPVASTGLWEDYRGYLEERFQKKFAERAYQLERALATCVGSDVKQQMRCAVYKEFGGRVQQHMLAALDMNTTTEKLDTNVFSANLRSFEMNSRSTSLRLPTSLTPAEQFLYQVLARVLVREFESEKLDCYYRLVVNSHQGRAYPPDPKSSELREYMVGVRSPDFADEPARETRERICAYAKAPTKKDELSDQFVAAVSKRAEPRVYAVTPKESVQRISDVSSRRAASEFLLGLNAMGGGGGVDAMLQSARQNEAFLHALRRQPLVVGYTRSGAPEMVKKKDSSGKEIVDRSDTLGFGWILGPQFAVDRTQPSTPSFRHTVRQQALSATIVAPIWWRNVEMTVKGTWRRERPTLQAFSGAAFEKKYSIVLPRKLSALDGLFDTEGGREPEVDTAYNTTVRVGQPARLLIRGDHMWRSSEVFIGSQPADRVRLLPDMKGLIADFAKIQPVYGAASVVGRSDSLNIAVGTSDGFVTVGMAKIIGGEALAPRSIIGIGRRVVGDQLVSLAAEPPLQGFRTLEVHARSSASASFNAKVADLSTGLEVSRDGAALRLVPKASDIKLQPGDPIDLVLAISSDATLSPEYVPLIRDAIYYPRPADHAAKIEWAAKGISLRKVKVTFPPGASKAFGSLASGRVDALAQMTVGGKSADLVPKVCVLDKGSCVVDLELPKTAAKDFTDAKTSGEFTLAIKLAGQDTPDTSPASLAGK